MKTNKIEINDYLIDEYIKNAPNKKLVHYWELPDGLCVKLRKPIKDVPFRGSTNSITIGKINRKFGYDSKIEKEIISLITWRNKKHEIKVKFPLSLINKEYIELYSLMLSEGSYKSESKLQVPEEEFHQIFINNLKKLFGNEILITQLISNGVKISNAPEKISYLLPITTHIPKFILENKEFAKLYLRIAFEAEANFRYKVLKTGIIQRRIKLSRNIGIDNIVKKHLPYEKGKRIYFGELKKQFPDLSKKILLNPCPIILGEAILLKKHFGINVSLCPEYLRINYTSYRRGKISVKWTMCIYSTNIETFVKEIGFITERKRLIGQQMFNIKKPHKSNYFALEIMKKVAKNNIFNSKDYTIEMLKLGYKFPRVFIAKYRKKNLIKKIVYCKYEI